MTTNGPQPAAFRPPEHDAFISYSRKDSAVVNQVCDELRQRQLKPWLDTEKARLSAHWRRSIAEAMRESAVFVLFLSKHSILSEAVTDEIRLARRLKLPLAVVRLDDEPLPDEHALALSDPTRHRASDPLSHENIAFVVDSIRLHGAPRHFRDGRLHKFRILKELGRGGMAKAYLAEPLAGVPEEGLHDQVVLKVMDCELTPGSAAMERFQVEARLGTRIRHKNVVRTLRSDSIRTPEREISFLVMEYVEGQNLAERRAREGVVSNQLCEQIAMQAARGLEQIHAQGAMHRDIKPENILITADERTVKIMDLGIARRVDPSGRVTEEGMFTGTLRFAAPESLRDGGRGADVRSDLFCLGEVLYEMLTGAHPFAEEGQGLSLDAFERGPLRTIGSFDVPVRRFFEQIVLTLLEADPTHRFQSAGELRTVLEEGPSGAWWKERMARLEAELHSRQSYVRCGYPTDIYGRERPLRQLHEALSRSDDESSQTVLLYGRAGIGKTRLVDAFVKRRREQDEDLYYLFGVSRHAGVSTLLRVLSDAVRELFGEDDLQAQLAEHLSETPQYLPALCALIRHAPPPSDQLHPEQGMIPLLFAQVISSLSKRRPVVLLLDDLHNLGEAERTGFLTLCDALRDSRTLVVVAAQRHRLSRDWREALAGIDGAVVINLQELDRDAETDILGEFVKSRNLARRLVVPVHEQARGSPFLLFEVIKAMKEAEQLTQTAKGHWVWHDEANVARVPASVSQSIELRLDGLGEDDMRLLRIAACWGPTFHHELIHTALDIKPLQALTWLERLEKQHQVVRSLGKHYVFDPPLVRTEILERMPDGFKPYIHAEIHAALESPSITRAIGEEEAAYRRCLHALQTHDPDPAGPLLDAAIGHLAETFRIADAVEVGKLALATPGLLSGARRADLLLRTTAFLDSLGRLEEEEEALLEAIQLAADAKDIALRARADARFGFIKSRSGEFALARKRVEDSLKQPGLAENLPMKALLTRVLGATYYREGEYTHALEQYKRHSELAHGLQSGRETMMATGGLASARWGLGQLEESLSDYTTQVELAARERDMRMFVMGLSARGEILASVGRLEEARDALVRARTEAERCGYIVQELRAEVVLGGTEARLGELEAGTERLRQAAYRLARISRPDLHAAACVTWGDACYRAGDVVEARQRYAESLELASAGRARRESVIAATSLAALDAGQLGQAEDAFEHSGRHLDALSRLRALTSLWRGDQTPERRAAAQAALDEIHSHVPTSTADILLEVAPWGPTLLEQPDDDGTATASHSSC